MTDDPMIAIDGLTKRFRASGHMVTAVDAVRFDVAEGEIVALLGPNGAGKSTLLRMLTTLLRPSAGTARVAGADILRSPGAVKRSIGYVAQMSATAGRGLRVAEEIRGSAQLQGLDRDHACARTNEVMETFGIAPMARSELRLLSGGQRRRVDIAIGLVHRPRVLLLDEPTTGLDPDSRTELWGHIRRLRELDGVSILMSTHYLDEADALADRLVALNSGRVITTGSPKQLKTTLAGDVVVVEPRNPGPHSWPVTELKQLEEVRSVVTDSDRLTVTVADAGTVLVDLVLVLVSARLPVASVRVRRAELKDIFAEITGRR